MIKLNCSAIKLINAEAFDLIQKCPRNKKLVFLALWWKNIFKTSGTICSSLQQNELFLKAYNLLQLKQKLKHSTNLLLNSKTMYTMCSAYNNIISVRAHSQHTSFLHAGHHISIEFVPDMKRTTVIHSCYVIIKVKSFSTSTIKIKTMFESWLNVLSNNENTCM